MNEQHVTFGRSLRLAIGLLASVLMAAGMLAAYNDGAATYSVANLLEGSASIGGNVTVLMIVMLAVLSVVVWGWVEMALLPDRMVPRTILLVIVFAACFTAAYAHAGAMAYVAAFAVPVVFLGEMLRTDGREKLLRHVSGVYVGGMMAMAGASWIMLARAVGGPQLGLVGVMAIVGGTLARYFVPGRWRELFVFLSAGVAAVIATFVMGDVSWWAPAVFAVGYLLVTYGMGRVARANTTVWQGSSAASFALLPHCALGIAGYALGLLVL